MFSSRSGRRPHRPPRLMLGFVLLLLLGQAVLLTVAETASTIAPQALAFAFPNSYGSPQVPTGVGAQGVQGPVAPVGPRITASAIGPVGHIGPTSKVYPYDFAKVPATLSVRVFNGTLHPNTAVIAYHATVFLRNVTTGKIASLTTTAAGYANFSTFVGWYVLNINITGGHVSWVQELWVGVSTAIVRYLIPSSYTTAAVNNGGTTTTLWGRVASASLPKAIMQLRVNLHNGSINGPVLTTAYTGTNGTVHFTGVNKAFTYTFEAIGWNSTLTDIRYFHANASFGQVVISGTNNNTFVFPVWGYDSYTATVTGTALPVGPASQNTWVLTSNTLVSNGKLYLTSAVEGNIPNLYSLTFVNSTVYWNWSGAGVLNVGLRFFFQNSTIIWMNQNNYFASLTSFWFNDSLFIGSGISSDPLAQAPCGHDIRFNMSLSSGFEYESTPCALVQSIGQSFQGNFVNSAFTNDSYVEFGILKNAPTHLISTSFTNTSIPRGFGPQSNVSFDKVRFVNSTVEPVSWQRVWMNQSALVNTTWWTTSGASNLTSLGNHYGAYFVNDTWLNLSYNGSLKYIGFDSASGIFGHDYFGFNVQGGKTVASVVAAIQANFPFGPWHIPGEHNMGIGEMLPTDANYSSSYFNFTESPSVNMTFWLLGAYKSTRMYNDVINANYSWPQLRSLALSTGSPSIGMDTLRIVNNPAAYINYSTLNFATGFVLGVNDNMTLAHDVFPQYDDINWWSTIQPYQSLPQGLSNLQITNSTFYRYSVNVTISEVLANYSSVATNVPQCCYPPQFADFAQGYGVKGADACFWYPCGGFTSVAYDTFYAKPSGIIQAEYILADMPFIQQIHLNNLYRNDVRYSPSTPNNGYSPPYACDVPYRGTWFNATGNWFLNLNNNTIPFCGEAYQVNHINAQATRARFVGNHYYYAPAAGQTIVDPKGPWYGRMTPLGGPTEPFTHSNIPSASLLSYVETAPPNATLLLADKGMLVFNTSLQATNVIYNAPEQIWGIAPDVNTTTGVPTVSYANGLIGGPQPNFTWAGHTYSESIEPTYIQLGYDSPSAPSVSVQFANLIGGKSYNVAEVLPGAGSVIANQTFVAASNGRVTAPYDPASMPSPLIFWLVPAGGGGSGGGPFGPSNLRVTAITSHSVSLAWTFPENVSYYVIHFGTSCANLPNSAVVYTTSGTVYGLYPLTRYCFTVSAVIFNNTVGTSGPVIATTSLVSFPANQFPSPSFVVTGVAALLVGLVVVGVGFYSVRWNRFGGLALIMSGVMAMSFGLSVTI